MHESVPPDAPFLSPISVLTGAQAFKDGLLSVKDREVYAGRVKIAQIAVAYTALLRWDEFRGFAANEVRGCFLVFVPTIREIRDFYREM
eukprot:SAG31_NODE_2443_length_5682_cov_3.662428_2_plen_89_part_00